MAISILIADHSRRKKLFPGLSGAVLSFCSLKDYWLVFRQICLDFKQTQKNAKSVV